MQLLVERCGFSPIEALAAAIYVPGRYYADILGRDDLAYLRQGAPADQVILGGDFRQDIRKTRDIDLVIARGMVYHASNKGCPLLTIH